MPRPNAIQQVFNPATQRTLLRIGLFLAVGLAVTLIVVFVAGWIWVFKVFRICILARPYISQSKENE